MENASKALIIAGEVLIGVLILSLAAYMLSLFGGFSKNMHQNMESYQISEFNVNFTNYSGKANISAQDVVSIINFAKQNNDKYDAKSGDDYFVDVQIDGTSKLNENLNNFLNTNKNSTYYYCNLSQVRITGIDDSKREISVKTSFTDTDIGYSPKTGLVNKINFHSINNTGYADKILNGYNVNFID